jgi:fusaric acid resistance family protein
VRPRLVLTAAWDTVIGSDPGLLRLRTGAVAALSVSLAVLLLTSVAAARGLSITVVLLGIILALTSSSLVREVSRRDRLITSALLPVAASASVTLVALLSPFRTVSTVVFVLVMFVGAYIRRFGPRGTALGMVGFISYFYALFLHAGTGQLVTLIVSALVGTACSALAREVLWPDRDTAVLAWLLPSVRARVGAALDGTRAALRDGELSDHADRRLRVRLRRLNESALLVEDRVERADQLWPRLSNEALALRVFDLELATEEVALASARLLHASHNSDGPAVSAEERRRLARLIGVLRRAVREDAGISLGVLDAADRLADVVVGRPAAPLVKAIQMMIHAIPRLRPDAAPEQPEIHPPGPDATEKPPAQDQDKNDEDRNGEDKDDGERAEERELAGHWPELLSTTRQAVQTAVAGGVAIMVGELLSPQRWYWAALTAFVVFIGTTSRGETLSKGWQRIVGTLGGVLAGVLVAAPLSDHHTAALALVVVCVFLAFYLQQVSHALLTFFITMLLALLYGLIGRFSVEVLALRLEETAAGAVCGVLASYLVLPISTRTTIKDKVADFADRLGDVVDHAADALCGVAPGDGLIAEARELDTATTDLRLATRPLSHGVAGVSGRRTVRRWLRAVRACDQYGRELAQVCYPLGWLTPAPAALREDGEAVDALREGCRRVRDHLEQLGIALSRPVDGTPQSAVPLFEKVASTHREQGDRALRDALRYLIRIEQILLAALGNRASERLDEGRPLALRRRAIALRSPGRRRTHPPRCEPPAAGAPDASGRPSRR